MSSRCDICGVELKEANGLMICPNHGIIEEQPTLEENDKIRGSYIG